MIGNITRGPALRRPAVQRRTQPSMGRAMTSYDLNELPVTVNDVRAAAETIGGAVLATACNQSRTLGEICGCNIWLKFENLQFTSSFKERGALNRLHALSSEQRERGVIAMSAGNHAQGVAYN